MHVLLVLLLAAAAVAAGGPHDASFSLDRKTHRQAQFYTGAKQKVAPLPLQYAAVTNHETIRPLYLRSHGKHFLYPLGNASLDLTFRGENRLWGRWRYAQVSNLTVSLSKSPHAPIHPSRAFSITCQTKNVTSSVWCHAGPYTADRLGHVITLELDLTQSRGRIPPWLWIELTRGTLDMRLHGAAAPVLSQASHGGTQCVSFTSSSSSSSAFTLCDDDAPYFQMQEPDKANVVTIGAAYWQANNTLVQIDGLAQTITAQTSTPVQTATDVRTQAWQWGGLAVALLDGIVVFGLWIMGPRLLRFDVYLWHVLHARDGATANQWHVHWTTTVGGLLMVPLAATSMVMAWVGGAYVLDEASIPVVDGFTFDWFAASLTAYVGAQMIIGAVAMVVFEWRHAPLKSKCGHGAHLWRWIKWHHVDIRMAWIRNVTLPTSALASAILALMPLLMIGGDSGEEVLCWAALPFALILLWVHTFYGIVLLAVSLGSASVPRTLVILGVVELLLLGWLITTMGMLFLYPVFNANAVHFGPAYINLAVWLVLSLPVVFAAIAILMQTTRVMKLMREEGEVVGTKR